MTTGNIMTALKERERERPREALAFPRLFIGKRSGSNNNYGRSFFLLPLRKEGESYFSFLHCRSCSSSMNLFSSSSEMGMFLPHSFTLVGQTDNLTAALPDDAECARGNEGRMSVYVRTQSGKWSTAAAVSERASRLPPFGSFLNPSNEQAKEEKWAEKRWGKCAGLEEKA